MSFHETLPGIVDRRRRRRDDDALAALGHQLEHVLDEFDLQACVVSTRDGFLLASPPRLDERQCALLAAAAPCAWDDMSDHHVHDALAAAGVDTDRSTLHVEPFDVLGQRLFVLTVSERPERSLGIDRCVGGVTRIMNAA